MSPGVGRIASHRSARRAVRARMALLAALFAGCGSPASTELPGAWWAGNAAAVREVLGQLAQLEGTPLARRASELAAALPDCESVGVHAPDGDIAALGGEVRCLADGDALERIRRESDSELVFALPASGHVVRGALRRENGALAIDLRWPDPPDDGALSLFVPGALPVGPDRLASTGRLVQLRVRPRAGLDLAALVPDGSQADRLFRLKSGIFASAVLDGTWEGAVYLPERADAMPGIALALGFSMRSAAVSAIERFIADLQETWPVHRSPLQLEAGDGACLLDLNVLPDLAPCYVATKDTLVVGWNPTSLKRALAAPTLGAPDAPARFDLDLAAIQRADDLLARAFPGSQRPLHWPWSRVLATGGEDRGALVLRVTLVPRPGSAS